MMPKPQTSDGYSANQADYARRTCLHIATKNESSTNIKRTPGIPA